MVVNAKNWKMILPSGHTSQDYYLFNIDSFTEHWKFAKYKKNIFWPIRFHFFAKDLMNPLKMAKVAKFRQIWSHYLMYDGTDSFFT